MTFLSKRYNGYTYFDNDLSTVYPHIVFFLPYHLQQLLLIIALVKMILRCVKKLILNSQDNFLNNKNSMRLFSLLLSFSFDDKILVLMYL